MRDAVYKAILTLRHRGFKIERDKSDHWHWLTDRGGRHLYSDAMLIEAADSYCSQWSLPLQMLLPF